MGLKQLLELEAEKDDSYKLGVSEERINGVMDAVRQQIAFYREYPDLLVDFLKGPDSTFEFYFYQRIFLRIVMRHRFVYATFPRA